MFGLERRRWERLREEPFPPAWLRIIERNVPLCRRLSVADRDELRGHVQVLLAEKNFEGAGGLEMTDEIRVTIAAQAAILLLHRDADYFPRLRSVVVYPSAFVVDRAEMTEGGYMIEGLEAHLGESWDHGAVVLSWDDVRMGTRDSEDGYNVVLHEFAHQLDREDGGMDGVPLLDESPSRWLEVLRDEFNALRDAASNGRVTVLDHYGAESPAEFFAVATEAFFERSTELRTRHPELYEALSRFFNQKPAEWVMEPS